MTTKKRSAPGTHKSSSAIAKQVPLHHRLDALLHTMRCIAQYEDALCELTHDVKLAGTIKRNTAEEISNLLEKIPSHDFVLDVEALRAALAEVPPSKAPRLKGSAKSVAAKSKGRRQGS